MEEKIKNVLRKAVLNIVTNGLPEMVVMMTSGVTIVMMNTIVMGLKGEDGATAISIFSDRGTAMQVPIEV